MQPAPQITYLAVFDRPLTPAMRRAFWEAARPKPWWRRAWRWLRRTWARLWRIHA